MSAGLVMLASSGSRVRSLVLRTLSTSSARISRSVSSMSAIIMAWRSTWMTEMSRVISYTVSSTLSDRSCRFQQFTVSHAGVVHHQDKSAAGQRDNVAEGESAVGIGGGIIGSDPARNLVNGVQRYRQG